MQERCIVELNGEEMSSCGLRSPDCFCRGRSQHELGRGHRTHARNTCLTLQLWLARQRRRCHLHSRILTPIGSICSSTPLMATCKYPGDLANARTPKVCVIEADRLSTFSSTASGLDCQSVWLSTQRCCGRTIFYSGSPVVSAGCRSNPLNRLCRVRSQLIAAPGRQPSHPI